MRTRADFLLFFLLLGACYSPILSAATPRDKPNLIIILAPDLGYGDLSCYGQKQYKTPRLDAMAAAGLRFTQFYAGSPIGAPSRCVLLTGRHGGRAVIRGYSDKRIPFAKDQITLASLLKSAGYSTAYVGQWDAGTPQETTSPNDAGFGHFRGAVSSAGSSEHSHEHRVADALGFIRENKDKPFFILYAPRFPSIEAPASGEFAAKDWPVAEKIFAAAVQLLDRDTGRILASRRTRW